MTDHADREQLVQGATDRPTPPPQPVPPVQGGDQNVDVNVESPTPPAPEPTKPPDGGDE